MDNRLLFGPGIILGTFLGAVLTIVLISVIGENNRWYKQGYGTGLTTGYQKGLVNCRTSPKVCDKAFEIYTLEEKLKTLKEED